MISGGITLHSYEIIVGSSPTLTTILGLPKGAPPSTWFSVPQYVGLANLTFKAPANPSLLAANRSGDPTVSGHIFVDNVDFESTADLSGGAEQMFALSGPDIQVYNSIFSSDSFINLSIEKGDGAIVSGNQFSNEASTNGFNDSQNIIAEMNTITSNNAPGSLKAGAAFDISRSISSFGPSHLSRNIYIGYNTLQKLGGPQQPVITTDGGGGAYYGTVASSTSDTIVLADQPSWVWIGKTNPEAAMIVIVSGTGAGQYSTIRSYSGQTINSLTPWKVSPDSTSIVVITAYALNLTIAHNSFTDTASQTVLLCGSQESRRRRQPVDQLGGRYPGVGEWPIWRPCGFSQSLNNEVLRNTIAVGAGDMIVPAVFGNTGGIGERQGYGTII